MTFSTKVKEEMLSAKLADGNELSMLCGIILSAGSIVIASRQMTFNIVSENYDLLVYSKKLINKLFPRAQVTLPKQTKNTKTRHTLSLDPESAQEILLDCGILERDDFGRLAISLVGGNFLLQEREGKLAYLAGCFLGGGTVSVPTASGKGGYHLEWSFASSNQAQTVAEILAEQDVISKIVQRGDEYVTYIKDSEAISTVLGLIGATNSFLQLESQKVERGMRNLVNRQSNCISANIDKAVAAGLKQVEAIKLIQSTIGLKGLPASLQQIATLRLANPDASLAELAELVGGGVTKSAINLRLRKIMAIAAELDSN